MTKHGDAVHCASAPWTGVRIPRSVNQSHRKHILIHSTVLGASLHDILTRLKAEAQLFSKLDLIYEHDAPVTEPVVVNLPNNGIRLRFDGAEQRLRLIEVLDFTKNQLSYQNKDVFRHAPTVDLDALGDRAKGPTFRHVQRSLIGPAFPGEYIAPEDGDTTGKGLYIMSYPGVAFSFPIDTASWAAKPDATALLSASTSSPAVSMAIFPGELWPDAREHLYTQVLNPREAYMASTKARESIPEEICLVRIHGEGRLELIRHEGLASCWIQLGSTSPQDLVASLGPPDAIYRKNDQRMSIHKTRSFSGTHRRVNSEQRIVDDSTDTDVSSAHTATDDSDDADGGGEIAGIVSGECFYNYFYHGFDILIAPPTTPSQRAPSNTKVKAFANAARYLGDASSRVVATKLILHGNVPGSYPFNRHRRCRWEIEYLQTKKGKSVNSETTFSKVEQRLYEEWKGIYKDEEEARYRQRGMVLNRDWGNSPGSSVELLGGWEESVGGRRMNSNDSNDMKGLGNTTLYGFPGLVFEVLSNDTVSGLTVF